MTHHVDATLLAVAVVAQGIGVVLAVLGAYNLFRTVVMDLRAMLSAGEGTSYARIAAVTLGVATALILAGRALESIAR